MAQGRGLIIRQDKLLSWHIACISMLGIRICLFVPYVIIMVVILHANTWRCAKPFSCVIPFNPHSISKGKHPGF